MTDLSKLDFSVGRDLNVKQAEGKESPHEGHGFSRAADRPSNDAYGANSSARSSIRRRRLERPTSGANESA
jgi:hypothetical protein